MRRRRNAQDSLELFLDTICNMFGGFLFIMLFVVVAMRDSVENSESEAISQERMSAAAFEELEIELETLRDENREFEERAERAGEMVDSLGLADVADARRQEIDVLRRIDELVAENARKLRETTRIERLALELDAEKREAKMEQDSAQSVLAEAERDAAEAERRAQQRGAPPQMRDRNFFYEEAAVILKYGRLYLWQKLKGGDLCFNPDDFHVVKEGLSVQVEPIPSRGVDLRAPGVTKELDRTFAPFDREHYRIAIVVADDSYDEYAIVRDYLKERKFFIRPLIGEKGTAVVDRGGSETRSQ
ncbi:MAG: hypothetical protein ACI4NV_09630 [Thermoguttaceae bacterium]